MGDLFDNRGVNKNYSQHFLGFGKSCEKTKDSMKSWLVFPTGFI